MTLPQTSLTLSAEDSGRVAEIQRLTHGGAANVTPLLALLGEKSWAVRRAVVAALARIGTPAVAPLCALLAHERKDEARVAAAVDALSQAGGDVDTTVVALAESASEPPVICDAAQVLGRRKSAMAVPALAKLSAHTDDNVAVAAIEALGRIGGGTAIEPLIAAVRTRNFFRAFPAIEVLGSSGDPRVVVALSELLDDPVYAGEAIAALGKTGQIAAVAPLASILTAGADAPIDAAVHALFDLRNRYASRFVDAEPIVHAFRETVPSDVATSRLLGVLNETPREDRAALACVLGWVKDTRVVGALVGMLDAAEPVAVEATTALRNAGSVAEAELLSALQTGDSCVRHAVLPIIAAKLTSVAALVACLDDSDATVRSQACEMLGRIGDVSAVPALFPAIGDVDARVAQSALAAIQSLGSARTETLAIEAARTGDVRTRRAALRIISYFGYPAGLEVLLSATTDENEKIRDAATQGLAFLDDPRAVESLLKLAKDPVERTRAAAMRALGQSSSTPIVVAQLRSGLHDTDAWVRYYACQALSRIGAREAVADISKLTEDPAGQVRVAAIEATAKLGGEEAHVALDRAADSPDADVRRAALTGLGSMKRVESLPIFLRALRSDDAATRLITLSALDRLDAPGVFEAVVGAVSDSDADVRRAAMTLVEQRSDVRTTRWLLDQLRNDSRREDALRALSIPKDRRLEEIMTALEGADAVLAPLLVTALARMHRADGNAAIVSALGFDNVFARRAAATALASITTSEARAALREAGDVDTDDEVRNISTAASS